MKMDFFNNDTSIGQRKNSESPTGIEPMASLIPVGHSNQLSYKRLGVNGDSEFFLCPMLVSLLKNPSSIFFLLSQMKNVEIRGSFAPRNSGNLSTYDAIKHRKSHKVQTQI